MSNKETKYSENVTKPSAQHLLHFVPQASADNTTANQSDDQVQLGHASANQRPSAPDVTRALTSPAEPPRRARSQLLVYWSSRGGGDESLARDDVIRQTTKSSSEVDSVVVIVPITTSQRHGGNDVTSGKSSIVTMESGQYASVHGVNTSRLVRCFQSTINTMLTHLHNKLNVKRERKMQNLFVPTKDS